MTDRKIGDNHNNNNFTNCNSNNNKNYNTTNIKKTKIKETEMKKYFQNFKRTNSANAIGLSDKNTTSILKNCTFNNYKKCSH